MSEGKTSMEQSSEQPQQNVEQSNQEPPKEDKSAEEQATEDQLAKWKTEFENLADEEGCITSDDLEKCLQINNRNPTQRDIKALMSCISTDRDGKIGFEEFIKIRHEASKMTFYSSDIQLELEEALEAFDDANDGTISKDELKKILVDYDDQYLNDVITHTDTNKDGKLSIKVLAACLTQIPVMR